MGKKLEGDDEATASWKEGRRRVEIWWGSIKARDGEKGEQRRRRRTGHEGKGQGV